MAIDSQAKRMAAIGAGSPIPSLLPAPDSSVGDSDRLHLAWYYLITITPVARLVLAANVAIRLIAEGESNIRSLAQAVSSIRLIASGEVEL